VVPVGLKFVTPNISWKKAFDFSTYFTNHAI
jgi:hypothetical protein